MSPNIRTYRVLRCPLCSYVTGVAAWTYGVENAQGALASHLHRKKHGLSRTDARELAKAQPLGECDFDVDAGKYIVGTPSELSSPAGTESGSSTP